MKPSGEKRKRAPIVRVSFMSPHDGKFNLSLDIASFHGGLWHCISQMIGEDAGKDRSDHHNDEASFFLLCSQDDIEDFTRDEVVLKEFPLPQIIEGHLPYLQCKTWEEHVRTLAEDNIPEEVPDTWQNYNHESDQSEDNEDSENNENRRHNWASFPLSLSVLAYSSMSCY